MRWPYYIMPLFQEESSAPGGEAGSSEGGSLAAAAAEYERSHARPPPPTAHYNVTGEEGETNVLQVTRHAPGNSHPYVKARNATSD